MWLYVFIFFYPDLLFFYVFSFWFIAMCVRTLIINGSYFPSSCLHGTQHPVGGNTKHSSYSTVSFPQYWLSLCSFKNATACSILQVCTKAKGISFPRNISSLAKVVPNKLHNAIALSNDAIHDKQRCFFLWILPSVFPAVMWIGKCHQSLHSESWEV